MTLVLTKSCRQRATLLNSLILQACSLHYVLKGLNALFSCTVTHLEVSGGLCAWVDTVRDLQQKAGSDVFCFLSLTA